ncbi:MAG: class I mannose-6-phosphate isomerase [Afipia sp.]|nr:class I mannose-6-phosphate isomerase [Afipia sp.]
MAAEQASAQLVCKPWGSTNLRPWSNVEHDGVPIGELWFQRTDKNAPDPALLLKLLFTTQPLSIQVHPNDAFAQSIGLANGKTEAWYILSAAPHAEVAIGLKRLIASTELRAAIADGSIVDMVQWRPVQRGDVYSVSAGTVHAIGAGIVLVEIQQRSDATFRIFDYERQRDLHVENALAVADLGPAEEQSPPEELSDSRIALIASRYFVLEKISLPPGSRWALHARRETWMLVLEGGGRIGITDVSMGDVMFVEAERVDIQVGPDGLDGLLAYPGPDPDLGLLEELSSTTTVATSGALQAPAEQGPPGDVHKQPEVQA